jgi:uncharacterized protein YqfA (UPF0365 family)
MATTSETRISKEASALLDCCLTGLDQVVYDVAEQIARQRSSIVPLRIEAADVQTAASLVMDAIRTQVHKKMLPEAAGEAMGGMESCLNAKAGELGVSSKR